jgi:hypothetical protein
MASGDKSWRDCDCNSCYLIRITYALRVAANCKDIKPRDMERALLMITHGIMMEDVRYADG